MARNQRKYDVEYKIQAVKLSKEIGSSKAGRLDIGGGAHTPESAMSLAEELSMLRKQIKQQDKEIRRLKEENEFLAEASAFSQPAVGSQQTAKNEIPCDQNGRRHT